ncbi:hypothetical protein K439DRAFT_1626417 [Ramaria rubella]|nr:hypothetical protein K439DRAFT_1626417 [Ramaria rubella]
MRRPATGTNVQPSSSSRRTLPIKRADAELLSREDIQYDLLEAIFNDQHAVFTNQSPEVNTSRGIKKVTFCELYSLTIIASPRCSKVLREKMTEIPKFAIDFAKIALLANVGRINTTMAFFPEMRTVLRSYHPIPSLQKTEANLQDAPRIKNCLKACLLSTELANPPSTPADIFTNRQNGIVPSTSIVNLIFVLSNHSIPISKMHFEPPFDFLDLFLPVNASSPSRAQAFLWLMFHYLETPSVHNPFSDEFADKHPGKIPKLVMLTPRQRSLENVDTAEELDYGRRMAHYRSKFLQQQIASEEKEKTSSGSFGVVKAKFKITIPSMPARQPSRRKTHDELVAIHYEKENFHTSPTRLPPAHSSHQAPSLRHPKSLPFQSGRTMLERAS